MPIKFRQLEGRPLPTVVDKELAALTTVLDFDPATGSTLTYTPTGDPASPSYVRVNVNGVAVVLGNGVKTKDCYFVADALPGTAARFFGTLVAGDILHWVGSVAGFQLAAGVDVISYEYDGP
jgi:hypothetical protein